MIKRSRLAFALICVHSSSGAVEDDWIRKFVVEKASLSSTGRNAYFVLEPGHRLELAGGGVRLVVTVLDETKVVDGVECRVVEEQESKGGQLAEVSRNYFAISKVDRSVYYFGEDVDMYKNGKVVSHEGAWLSGVNGARFGLMVPGKPEVEVKYHQEFAPKVAMDRAEIVSVDATATTPAGKFKHCLKTRETTPLEPGVVEFKVYAPGVGLVQDAELNLVKHTSSK